MYYCSLRNSSCFLYYWTYYRQLVVNKQHQEPESYLAVYSGFLTCTPPYKHKHITVKQPKEQPPAIWPFPTYKGEPYKVKVKPEAKPEKGLEYLGKALF